MIKGPVVIDLDKATDEEWETVYETLRTGKRVEAGPRVEAKESGTSLQDKIEDTARALLDDLITRAFQSMGADDDETR